MRGRRGLTVLIVMLATLSGCSFNNDYVVKTELSSLFGAKTGCIKVEKKIPVPDDITVHEEVITVPGLTEEFELVFTADNHISLCDDRDPSVAEKARERYEYFKCFDGSHADESFESVIKYVESEEPNLFVLGGDVVDSAMYAGIEFVSGKLSELETPYLYGIGNHDFEYGSEYYTSVAFSEYLPRLSQISDISNGVRSIEFDEVVVLIADDYCNKVTPAALAELQRVCSLGKTVIVSVHVPIEPGVGDSLWEMSKAIWGQGADARSRVLLGSNSCTPDETTQAFIDEILRADSPVKAVLAGHVHFYHKDMLNDRVTQFVAGPGFNKEVTKLILKPENIQK